MSDRQTHQNTGAHSGGDIRKSLYLNVIPIDEIKVGKRLRKNLGDIESLSASISKFGLQNPISLRKITGHNGKITYVLVSGWRRLVACRQLTWSTIVAKVEEWSIE